MKVVHYTFGFRNGRMRPIVTTLDISAAVLIKKPKPKKQNRCYCGGVFA